MLWRISRTNFSSKCIEEFHEEIPWANALSKCSRQNGPPSGERNQANPIRFAIDRFIAFKLLDESLQFSLQLSKELSLQL